MLASAFVLSCSSISLFSDHTRSLLIWQQRCLLACNAWVGEPPCYSVARSGGLTVAQLERYAPTARGWVKARLPCAWVSLATKGGIGTVLSDTYGPAAGRGVGQACGSARLNTGEYKFLRWPPRPEGQMPLIGERDDAAGSKRIGA
jgi:hypothetical protein